MRDPPADDPALTRAGTPRRRAPRARRALPLTPAMLADAPEFAPVPSLTNRHDGWSYDRQRAFIAGLAETGCVDRAARRIGMTAVGAYRLRKARGAAGFAKAWAEALTIGVQQLRDVAFDRAINGVPVPVFYKGEQVGERRWYNDRLLIFTLRHHDPETYGHTGGGLSDRVPPHVRAQLRREWEAERAAKDRAEAKGVRERLLAKLEDMHRRMKASDALFTDLTGAPADPAER